MNYNNFREELHKLSQDARSRINFVINSKSDDMADLRRKFSRFDEFSDIFFTAGFDGIFLHYTVLGETGVVGVETVLLPEWFVIGKDF